MFILGRQSITLPVHGEEGLLGHIIDHIGWQTHAGDGATHAALMQAH